jgi:hypothetical protein
VDRQFWRLVGGIRLDNDFLIGFQLDQERLHLPGAIQLQGLIEDHPLSVVAHTNDAVTANLFHGLFLARSCAIAWRRSAALILREIAANCKNDPVENVGARGPSR